MPEIEVPLQFNENGEAVIEAPSKPVEMSVKADPDTERVYLCFDREVSNLNLDPKTARLLAENIRQASYVAARKN